MPNMWAKKRNWPRHIWRFRHNHHLMGELTSDFDFSILDRRVKFSCLPSVQPLKLRAAVTSWFRGGTMTTTAKIGAINQLLPHKSKDPPSIYFENEAKMKETCPNKKCNWYWSLYSWWFRGGTMTSTAKIGAINQLLSHKSKDPPSIN